MKCICQAIPLSFTCIESDFEIFDPVDESIYRV